MTAREKVISVLQRDDLTAEDIYPLVSQLGDIAIEINTERRRKEAEARKQRQLMLAATNYVSSMARGMRDV